MSWKSSTSSSETTNGLARLVSRFRSSHHCAAHSFANFGIKGTLAIYDSSAVFGFEVPTQTRGYNDRNFKSTALAPDGLHAPNRRATFTTSNLTVLGTAPSYSRPPLVPKSARPASNGNTDRVGAIYRALRHAIIEQALSPGAKLPEDAIGERFGASRTIVRHVLGQLAAEGLVELRRNRGAAVATPSWDEARDMFDVRLGLERLIVSRLAGRLTADQIKRARSPMSTTKSGRAAPTNRCRSGSRPSFTSCSPR